MPAVLAIILSAFSFSFFPLVNAIGLKHSSPIVFSFFNQGTTIFMSFTVLLFVMGGWSPVVAALRAFLSLPLKTKLIAVFSGVSVYLGGIFFLFALSLMSKAGAAVIMETWPILAIVISPFLIRKAWEKLGYLDILSLVICFIGVVFITVSETGQTFSEFISHPLFMFENYEFMEYIGVVLAFLASYCFAFSGVSRAQFVKALPQEFRTKHFGDGVNVSEAVYTYLLSYIIGLPLASFLFLFIEPPVHFSFEAFTPGLINGVILTATSALYSYALLKAKSPSINIIWYFAPLMAAMWLWLYGEAQLTDMLVIGGVLIVVANIALVLKPKKKSEAKGE